jgi:hypothetical protein
LSTARFARRPTDGTGAPKSREFDVIAIDWVSVTVDAHFAANLTEICEIGHRIDTLRLHIDRCTADAEITYCPIFTDILTGCLQDYIDIAD